MGFSASAVGDCLADLDYYDGGVGDGDGDGDDDDGRS